MNRILAIDDRKDNLITIEAVISSFMTDVEIITELDGARGIETALNKKPDTIILDINMPGKDGYQTCAELKENPETAHIPIILLTAVHTKVEDRIKGLEIGADAFLTKPIDEAELIAQIRVMLRIKSSEDLLRKEKELLEVMVEDRTRELKKSQETVILERDFIKSLNDAAPAYFVACNEMGSVIELGQALITTLELDSKYDISTINFYDDLIESDFQDLARAKGANLISQGKKVSFEAPILFNDQPEILAEWHGKPHYTSSGKLQFLFFVGIDITERRRLEKMLVKSDEQEKMNIGRDLHDGLGQYLAGIMFKSEALKISLEDNESPLAPDAEEIHKMVSRAINQTRDLARGLCPVDTSEGGLTTALSELAEEINQTTAIKALLKKEGNIIIEDATIASQLYYIAREAVNNSVKHGNANTVIITISRTDDSIVIKVSDDGVGISTSHNKTGTGLEIMQYRAWIIGGSLSFGTRQGGGTEIQCFVRITSDGAREAIPTTTSTDYNATKTDQSRVLIVDDHPIVRQGLAQIVEREPNLMVCGEARNAEEAIRFIDRLKPNLVTVDISLEGTSGIDLVKAIKTRFPGLPCLVISIYNESIYAERAIAVGARGYVMKQQPSDVIIKAIKTVLSGKQFFSEEIKEKFMNRFSFDIKSGSKISLESLTNREFEVFQFIGQGMKNTSISEKLNIGIKTVENYRERIKNKLNLNSAADLVQFAVQWQLNHSKD